MLCDPLGHYLVTKENEKKDGWMAKIGVRIYLWLLYAAQLLVGLRKEEKTVIAMYFVCVSMS